LVAADAGKAALRTITAERASFVLLNISYLLVELRGPISVREYKIVSVIPVLKLS
jgi:hypothetical protein